MASQIQESRPGLPTLIIFVGISSLLSGTLLATPTPTPTPSCTDDTWTVTSTTNAPIVGETAIWTGSDMIVWGGYDGTIWLNSGGRYNPSTQSWTATNTANAPPGRSSHTAIWTGSEMIVWGGWANGAYLNSGGKYNPATDTWTATSTTNAPSPRDFHTAVWTGSEMIIWGGYFYDGIYYYRDTGGRYNPVTDTWTATSTTDVPTGRGRHTAVWTGSEMIVWGGNFTNQLLNTGARYNPGSNSWTAISTTNAPIVRWYHLMVWTGNEMIVWGGVTADHTLLNSGGLYNPDTDSWIATSTNNAPTARGGPVGVWTGSEMIVWSGGNLCGDALNDGGRYNPTANNWRATSITNAPTGAANATWTGSEMIVASVGSNTVWSYCAHPATTPPPTPTPTPPSITISGTTFYCAYPSPGHLSNVTLALSGSVVDTTRSDGCGNYTLSVPLGGSYTLTPSKAPRAPGSWGINTIDVLFVQGHFLRRLSLSGCRLDAADVNADNSVNTVDVVAIQRFFLGLSIGIANVGSYRFTPPNRTFEAVVGDQTAENYEAVNFGDVDAN